MRRFLLALVLLTVGPALVGAGSVWLPAGPAWLRAGTFWLGAGTATAATCDVPTDLVDSSALPRSVAAIRQGELRILVGGSATAEAGGSTQPYHARIAALLNEHFPALRVVVEARGQRGATAPESLALILRELPALRPHLVIWQTGTVEAVRSLEVDELTHTLNDGITRIRAAGADVALMDQQFSRFLRANADIDRYRDAMRMTAAAEGVSLLRRYDWMRHWVESDGPDMERASRPDRSATLAQLQDCLARAIIAQLRAAARPR